MYGMQFVQSMLHPNILHSVKHVTAAGPHHNLWPKHTHHETPYLILCKLKEKYCSFLLKKSYFIFYLCVGKSFIKCNYPWLGKGRDWLEYWRVRLWSELFIKWFISQGCSHFSTPIQDGLGWVVSTIPLHSSPPVGARAWGKVLIFNFSLHVVTVCQFPSCAVGCGALGWAGETKLQA